MRTGLKVVTVAFPAMVIGIFLGAAIEHELVPKHSPDAIVRMVEAGASPVEAACSLGLIKHDAPVCIMAMTGLPDDDNALPENFHIPQDHRDGGPM